MRWLWVMLGVLATVPAAGMAAVPKRVLAFYYTWYGTPQFGGAWRHWNEGGHNPEVRSARGIPDTGTTDHPIALYDSQDPAVVRRHIQMALQAGIDGFISTWWGQGDYHDTAFRLLLDEAQRTPLRATIYYETVHGSDPVAAFVSDMDYVLTKYGSHPAFLKQDEKPVVFVYGRAMGQLTRDQWREALAQVRARHQVLIIADSLDPSWLPLFDGLHEYNPVGATIDGTDMLKRYFATATACRVAGKLSCATVIPGYDDSHIGRATPIISPRLGGDLYRRLWSSATDAKPDWVLICSFNEWHEGSEIEPSVEYGDLYMRLTRDFARIFKGGTRFAWRSGGPAVGRVSVAGQALVVGESRRDHIELDSVGTAAGVVRVGGLQGPVAFELGRGGALWRLVDLRRTNGGAWTAVAPGRRYGVWSRHTFLATHARSPFAGVVRLRLQPTMAMEYAAGVPRTYRVCPGQEFSTWLRLARSTPASLGGALSWSVKLRAPEGWSAVQAASTASGSRGVRRYTVRVPADAPVGAVVPIIAVYTVRSAGRSYDFHHAVDVSIEEPARIALGTDRYGHVLVTITSSFPRLRMPVKVTTSAMRGRTATPAEASATLGASPLTIPIRITRAPGEAPGLWRTYIGVNVGEYGRSATVVDTCAVRLGSANRSDGLQQVECEDGVTRAATVDGRDVRLAVPQAPNVGAHYIYFRVGDGMPASGPTYVTVTYRDSGPSSVLLQYDSTDERATLEGRYKDAEQVAIGGTGRWVSHTWVLPDASLRHRQNGSTDFRLAIPGSGDLAVERVVVSKWQ